MRKLFSIKSKLLLTLCALALSLFVAGCGGSDSAAPAGPVVLGSLAQPSATAWKFAVMADTQWIGTDDGKNPNSVSVDIIQQLNKQFINQGVKFVVQAGDVVESYSAASLATHALFVQPLYNAGIGYFPLRGNHEGSAAAATEFVRVFPQTQTGQMNATPADALAVTNPDAAKQPSPAKTGAAFAVGANFSSPSTNFKGLSYSFDYNNARFVLLDQFTPADSNNADGTPYNISTTIAAQQTWISSTLSGRPAGTHAFTFSHKGIITENHVDSLFGADPSINPAAQDAFIKSLAGNNVHYHMLGHDHMYDRSIITTTDGSSARFQQILCASDSSKFYIPTFPANDITYNLLGLGTVPPTKKLARQTQIAQELNTVGYYIFTVDGSNVTVDYYSAPVYPTYSSGEYLITATPALNFTKRETFGYSLKGQEFMVAQSMPYNSYVLDTFKTSAGGNNTTAKIIDGINESALFDFSGRSLVKAVDTGWSAKIAATASDILTLWGMNSRLGSPQTDTYVLSLSYDSTGLSSSQLQSGAFGLATKDGKGGWINAVNQNFGGLKKFVNGPYNSSYLLGTYGIDVSTNTAWAVVNYNSDFAVVNGI